MLLQLQMTRCGGGHAMHEESHAEEVADLISAFVAELP